MVSLLVIGVVIIISSGYGVISRLVFIGEWCCIVWNRKGSEM